MPGWQSGGKMKKGDVIIIFVVLLLATLLSFLGTFSKYSETKSLIVVLNDEVVHEYTFNDSLKKEIIIEDGDHINVINIENGFVTMSEANCPDQVCVKTRPIKKSGEMIVCLPNRLYVKIISGNSSDDIDIIAS